MKKAIGILAALALSSVAFSASADENVQFRTSIGLGAIYDDEITSGVNIHGAATSLDMYLGGYLSRHLVIGAYLSDTTSLGTEVSVNGSSFYTATPVSLNLFSIGPYLDFTENHGEGWHLLLASGVSILNMSGQSSANSLGGNITGGFGYDWYVANHTKMGFLGKMLVSKTAYQNGVEELTVVPTVAVSVGF